MKGILKLFLLALVVCDKNPKFVAGNLHRQENSSSKVPGNDSEIATTLGELRSPVVVMSFDTKKYKEELNKIEQTKKAMKYLQHHSRGGEGKNPDKKPPRRPSKK